MRIGVTGPNGFLAWHLRCLMKARGMGDCVPIDRSHTASVEMLRARLHDLDVVVHLAGVNRSESDRHVFDGNVALAELLADAIDKMEQPPFVVFANSTHAYTDSTYGRAKQRTAEILDAVADLGNVVLPNIFGEFGRPNYHSFVATFASALARGTEVYVNHHAEVELLHAQTAVAALLDIALKQDPGLSRVSGTVVSVSHVYDQLQRMSVAYRTGQLPDLSDYFTRDLFNTYRSHCYPHQYPIFPDAMSDTRGRLFETVRCAGGQSQVFFSSTEPGQTRGQHFHLHKVERFMVIRGEALIRVRRLFGDEVVEFTVSGARPAIVDMPTLAAHAITNVGRGDLLTLFYADQVFNPTDSDTFPAVV